MGSNEPIHRWLVRARFGCNSIGELQAREHQLGRAAGRMPPIASEAGWAVGDRTATAEWPLETKREGDELAKRIRAQIGEAIPGLRVESMAEPGRVLQTEEIQITADKLRKGRAQCPYFGELTPAPLGRTFRTGEVVSLLCDSCHFRNEWTVIDD